MTEKISSSMVAVTGLGATTVVASSGGALPILDVVLWSFTMGSQSVYMTVQNLAFLTTAVLSSLAVMFTLAANIRKLFGGKK